MAAVPDSSCQVRSFVNISKYFPPETSPLQARSGYPRFASLLGWPLSSGRYRNLQHGTFHTFQSLHKVRVENPMRIKCKSEQIFLQFSAQFGASLWLHLNSPNGQSLSLPCILKYHDYFLCSLRSTNVWNWSWTFIYLFLIRPIYTYSFACASVIL